MKNRNDQQLTQYEIPGGEGFNALPIVFIMKGNKWPQNTYFLPAVLFLQWEKA